MNANFISSKIYPFSDPSIETGSKSTFTLGSRMMNGVADAALTDPKNETEAAIALNGSFIGFGF